MRRRLSRAGFFIVNGIDRLIRLLIVPRRHYVTAVIPPVLHQQGDGIHQVCLSAALRPTGPER